MNIVAACITCLLCTASLFSMPQQVILLRHGEKPAQGHTLSPKGFARAQELVQFFTEQNLPFQLQTVTAIFAQRSSKNHPSTRPVQTVALLANTWQIPLYTQYSRGDYKDMVDKVTKDYSSGMVMVCWDHEHLSAIASEFGVKNAPSWPGSVYNWVWVIDFSGSEVISFTQYLQNPVN